MKRRIYLCAVFLAQAAFLAGLLWYALLPFGPDAVEIVVRTEPIDPRDYFRGDYVILNYEFSRGPESDKSGTVYAILEQEDGSHLWKLAGWSDTLPERNRPGAKQVAIRGNGMPGIQIRYGIEKFFVEEGTGKDIENASRPAFFGSNQPSRSIEVTLRVTPEGRAAVKGVKIVENSPIEFFPEPLENPPVINENKNGSVTRKPQTVSVF